MNVTIPPAVFDFLERLKQNNNREWMDENRKEYLNNEKSLKTFYSAVEFELNKIDQIERLKVFRINRDLRFTPDKTPYNVHRSASFSRAGAARRGGYYLRIQPGNSMVAGGFFNPEKDDLFRIRKEFEFDADEMREILAEPSFEKAFGGFDTSYALKTAPRNFDKDHENIDLIRQKNFVVRHHFTDEEVLSDNFLENVVYHFELLRPFFDYMSMVLTTDLNGESILEEN